MYVNKLNQLFRPERVLYYREASEEDIALIGGGKKPGSAQACGGCFGAYDQTGIFFLKGYDKPVTGVEYRMDDKRIRYPETEHTVLGAAFFYSIEIDGEIEISREAITKFFTELGRDNEAVRLFTELSVSEESGIIGVFAGGMGRKLRILYEGRVDVDRSEGIIMDDMESLDRSLLYRMAFSDPITGHHNWNHLVPFLEMPMHKGIRDYAFAHFDIKAFRVINEFFGHNVANSVLCRVVKAMEEADFIYTSARCHNDNFAMLIKDMPQEEMLEKLKAFFDGLSRLDEDPDYRIYYRCGLVPMQRSMLLGNRVADAGKFAQAMGTKLGETEITVYTDEIHEDIMWSNYIKAYVDTAIAKDEFTVFLQPKIDAVSGKLVGSEALIRWRYKGEELLPPSRFIPFFEKDNTVGKIDDIVLKKVCEALAEWKKEGRALCPVSVNLSRKQLYDRTLTEDLLRIVDSYGTDHSLIDFELTESAGYEDAEHMIRVLNELRESGFEVSMDDFGTGYSSLSLLTEMPLDTLKIDKSFVDKIGIAGEEENDIIVLKHIITLAKELGIRCLAEGAESREQVDRLVELGCNIIQGYYYSRPIPIAEFEKKYL
ncbi:MAG: EAL domain-containing protein [Lachnospiraceae bacterium]|nr:EAL domain-containing protein [Lachnospiraceae bacterium]